MERRSRRRSRRLTQRLRRGVSSLAPWLVLGSFVVVTAVLVAAVSLSPNTQIARGATAGGGQGNLTLASTEPAAARATRPIYRHSVIPGGVYSAGELVEATEQDPVVFAEYGSAVRYAPVRVATSAAPRLVYMSYRIGDRIYWTRKKVRLNAGEVTLTNGQIEVRARCGNKISETAMFPASESEPDAVEFDSLVADEPDLLAAELGSTRLLGIGSVPGASPRATPPISGTVPAIPIGVPGGFGSVLRPAGVPGANASPEPGAALPAVAAPPGNTTNPPAADPPTTVGPPNGEPPDRTTPEPPGARVPPDDDLPPLEEPEEEVPTVPEPGTFVLLGTALAGLGALRLRQRLRGRASRRFL